MLALLLTACWSDSTTPKPVVPPPQPDAAIATAATVPLPAPRLGVSETVTPATVLRVQNIERAEPPRRFDVAFDPQDITFAGLRADLERWGFKIEDGDGEAWRVVAPVGAGWAGRLEPLREVLTVRAATTQDMLPDGSARTGSEHYGTVIRTWTMRAGTLTETLQGSPTPAKATLPNKLPPAVRACLAPLLEELEVGEVQGIGWERALEPTAPAWVLILEHYGACDASGWFAARGDAAIDALTVGGRPADKADESSVFVSAVAVLGKEQPSDDQTAEVALQIVGAAADDVLAEALPRIGDPRAQAAVWEIWARRDNAAALAWAKTSTLPIVRAHAAAQDNDLRLALLQDTTAPTLARRAAIVGWMPKAADQPLVDALRKDKDPVVRAGAWTAWMDAHAAACTERAAAVAKMGADEAARLYQECPQDDVGEAVIGWFKTQDKKRAGELVAAVLADPETLSAGMAAVRAAADLGRDDLLEAAVASTTLARDVRGAALRALIAGGRSGKIEELQKAHGTYVGVKPMPTIPAVATP